MGRQMVCGRLHCIEWDWNWIGRGEAEGQDRTCQIPGKQTTAGSTGGLEGQQEHTGVRQGPRLAVVAGHCELRLG